MESERNYVEIALEYARAVIVGEEDAGRYVRFACQRFVDDVKRADQGWDYELNEAEAARWCRFAENLPHVKGRTDRLMLAPWQVFMYVNLFGWLSVDTGLRRFRTAYIETPKKTGKTTIVAPIALGGLAIDGEEGAEIYSAATTQSQAKIVWGIAKQMANRTGEFRDRFGVECGAHAIWQHWSGSTFQPLSRESKSMEGMNPHVVVVDELHAHPTREVWDIITESTGARNQPLIIAITNSGADKASICYEQRSYLVQILEGRVEDRDETFWGVIYGIDPEDIEHWDNEKIWRKANPNLGVSVRIDDIRQKAAKARLVPSARAAFFRYQLGVWSERESPWIRSELWDERKLASPPDMAGRRTRIGIDLASKVDLAAAVAVAIDDENEDEDDHYIVVPRFYLPDASIGLNPLYDGWVREGFITATPGKTIDYSYIEEDLKEWCEEMEVITIPYDRFQATQFATRMTDEGLPMVAFSQTVANMSEPMKEIDAWVIDGHIAHDGNPCMSWMISNVVVQPDRKENIFPRKERPEDKIDGGVALIMASAMWLGEETPKPSVYQSRGLQTF